MTMQLRNLRIGYERTPIASIVDLTLTPDRLWMVSGPNGSGKTTLLKTLAGLLPAVAGSMTPRPRMGRGGAVYVHSVPMLWRGTIRRNLHLVAEAEAIAHVAALFELSKWLDVPTAELSHGIRQRASLARAVACAPAMLLVDEPEGGLDQGATERWTSFLESTIGAERMTVVIAAHRSATPAVPAERILLTPAR